jgi:4-hydroxythreonine-4-phosphate dehydrogenase
MTIAVSSGDPSGVGIEIALKAWREISNNNNLKFILFADFEYVKDFCSKIDFEGELINLNSPDEDFDFSRQFAIFQSSKLLQNPILGEPNPENGAAIIDYIKAATHFVKNGKLRALTTLPIAKSVLYKSGFCHSGHTEYVASLCDDLDFSDTRGPIMMLKIDGLRVALATIHIAINKVATQLNIENIINTTKITHEALVRDFGIKSPKIAILGLNPHAGEDGTMGDEEINIINPAAQKLRSMGINCTDALPADSAFASFNRQYFDAYIAMYHDQGLIPIKALDFWGGVNVTLGLPVIRTSPDHGTAFNIAPRLCANTQSFINALKSADEMAKQRANYER